MFSLLNSSSSVINTFYTAAMTCKEASNKLFIRAVNYKNKKLNAIPAEHRIGLTLRACAATVELLAFIRLALYTKDTWIGDKWLPHIGVSVIGGIDYFILSKLWNSKTKEIEQVIKDSHSKIEEKEGIALVLSAPKTADHNFAFAEGENCLSDMQILGERFVIENRTISTPKQTADIIEEVCTTGKLPVKIVYIRGHGRLESIYLGNGEYLYANDQRLNDALKKTDACAHIILKSCSTGKLRTEQGISMADQLSLNLPGRTVTGNSTDAAAGLVKYLNGPKKITLYNSIITGWKTSKLVPSHSFCVKENKRMVDIFFPVYKREDLKKDSEEYITKHTEEDYKHANEYQSNSYTFNVIYINC